MEQLAERDIVDQNFKKRCRKCLFQDISEEKIAKTIQAYVAHIEEDIKTPKENYEQRLDACRECESLLEGTCRVCGCFVEVRAAVSKNSCPAVDRKW